MRSIVILFICIALASASAVPAAETRPDYLWIALEDVNGWFSSYGETLIETPHIDQFAAEGARFDRLFVSAAVCSATRSGSGP